MRLPEGSKSLSNAVGSIYRWVGTRSSVTGEAVPTTRLVVLAIWTSVPAPLSGRVLSQPPTPLP